MSTKKERQQTAEETVLYLNQGFYSLTENEEEIIQIGESMTLALQNSSLFRPDHTFNRTFETRYEDPVISVTQETTLTAARRLCMENPDLKISVLNFASARNPGGGFLKGALAQEESLARSSGLYPCISQFDEMYSTNKRNKSLLYSHYMIYSPRVPVIRDDMSLELIRPYYLDFISAPAVNGKEVLKRDENAVELISKTMRERIHRILSIAAMYDADILVLGAWGCGVFGNDPEDVAQYFYDELQNFNGVFKEIVFAIYVNRKNDENNYVAFENKFVV